MSFLSNFVGALTGGSQRDAAEISASASDRGVAENRRQFDTALQLTAPTRNFQNQSQLMLAQLLGLAPYNPGDTGVSVGSLPGANYRPNYRGRPGEPVVNVPQRATNPSDNSAGLQPGQNMSSVLQNLPGYQFAVDEAVRNSNVGAAGRGEFFSGAAGDALQTRLHGLADSTFGNHVNRLLASANGGSSASQASSQAIQSGQIVSNGLQNAGDARASGVVGQANTIGNIVNGAIRGVFGRGS